MEEKLNGTTEIRNTGSEFLIEYYLVEDSDRNYGVKIEKKEKREGELILCENYTSEYAIKDKDKANYVLDLLVKNKVTPTTVEYILDDFGYLDK